MANLAGEYDPDAGVPGTFETFPGGNYDLELTESEIKATNAGTGKLLKYKVRVISGEYEDRLIFGQVNLQNPNPVATKMGQEEFRAMREVVGVLDPQDSEELHFIAFRGVVKVTPAKPKKDSPGEFYDAKNEIDWGKTYKLFSEGTLPAAANDNTPPANDNVAPPVKAAAVKPAPKAAAPGKAPWPKKAV